MRTIKPYTKKGRPFIMRDISLETIEWNFCAPQVQRLLNGKICKTKNLRKEWESDKLI